MSELDSESEISDIVPKKEEKKRKRNSADEAQEELEIDVNLPEPPSKKARRKEKQGKLKKTTTSENAAADQAQATEGAGAGETQTAPKRSEHGIWIGNLPFSATPDKLREFFQDKGDIDSGEIVRLNMPGPPGQKKEKNANGPTEDNPRTPQNKGFAYVDFTTKEVQEKALALSETLLVGRRVLIKDAKSFAGRPEAAKDGSGTASKGNGKEPSKKVFVGNLGFDVTKEDLTEVLGKAGTVEDCFLATFEDTGKCKGFGWVRFKELEGAQAAVKGFMYEQDDEEENDEREGNDEAQPSKKKKNSRRKTWVNMLNGRPLRCEFAEDANTRYKKRFGKDKTKSGKSGSTTNQYAASGEGGNRRANANSWQSKPERRDRSGDKEQRRDDRRKRHDARMIAPGQALAKAPRATAAIVEGAGKKTSFD